MIKLEENKFLTSDKTIEFLPIPRQVRIPLSQHIGAICSNVEVNIGDNVQRGQKIASIDAKVFAPIHSSVSGKIVAIQNYSHPTLGYCRAIIIESDGQQSYPESLVRLKKDVDNLKPEEIRSIIFNAGIVGLGGAAFPTHLKLSPTKPIDSLIINGAECEPYLTGDYRLMVEKTKELILGIDLIARCLNVKNIYIGIEDINVFAADKFNNAKENYRFQVKMLKSFYPQGGEKQLIKNILGKEIPRGKLPFDVGVVVCNIATIFAIYEAIYKSKTLYERVVTVSGDCLTAPKNILVPIGTPIKDLIEFCGPLSRQPEKIIVGGPMMGIAQYSLDVPVIKSTNGVILFSKEQVIRNEEIACIRCGACIRECPMGLMPCMINLAAMKEMWPATKEYGALDCIECGSCSFICPSNRLLVQSIKRTKLALQNKNV